MATEKKRPLEKTWVEFVAGPYDGYRYPWEDEAIAGWLQLPVSQNVVRILGGDSPGPLVKSISVANYELRSRQGRHSYCFVGSQISEPTQELQNARWCNEVLRMWRAGRHGSVK